MTVNYDRFLMRAELATQLMNARSVRFIKILEDLQEKIEAALRSNRSSALISCGCKSSISLAELARIIMDQGYTVEVVDKEIVEDDTVDGPVLAVLRVSWPKQ